MNRFYIAIVIFILGSALSSCGDKKTAAPNPASLPVPVNTMQVIPQKAIYYDVYPAHVVAMMQVDLHPEVEGYVTGIFFKEGTHVKKGEKLYQIDISKYQASYEQSQANVKVAEANLEQAQKDADRYVYLSQHDAVAKQTLDHAMTALKNAKSQLNAAKQEQQKTRTDLNYSFIKAPFDGTIGISQVKLGNTVTVGLTLLNTISTDDPMAVDFEVGEKQIPYYVKLQQKKPAPADSTFTLLMPDNTLYDGIGEMHLIDRGVNPLTGTTTVRLSFANQSNNLRAGMSCKVRVRNQDTTQQILMPGKAIVEQMGEYFVFIARDTAIANTTGSDKAGEGKAPASALHAIQKKVQLGQTIADKVIIKTGLQAGDMVITDGVQKLHDGSLIMTNATAVQGKQ